MRILVSPKESYKRVKRNWTQKDFENKALGLIDRILRFAAYLRANRFPVHTSCEIDAFAALKFVDINDPFQFYMALRTSFVTKNTQLNLFNNLYLGFWGTAPKIPVKGDDEEEESQDQEKQQIRKLDEEPSEDKGRKSGKKQGPQMR